MPEKCTDPQECPHIHRIEALEEGQEREENFRKIYYRERDARIERDARLDERITAMDKKLDELLIWQKAQESKPGKRWDSIVDKAIWAVVGAVIVFLLAKVGL